jgi:N-acetylglucosamine-6-phosphate deacetylase
MTDTLIAAGRIIPATAIGPRVLSPGFLRVRNGVIAEVGEGAPPAVPDMELPHGVLVPGLVDLQVNGYFGVEMAVADGSQWATVVRRLPETGTTAFLPTFITAPVHKLASALRRTADLVPDLPIGARVLGVHVEGPFISSRYRRAHDAEWIIDPVPEAVTEILTAGKDLIRVITLAPERDGAIAAIARLVSAGVLVSVGHSEATAAQVAAAADAGARMVTHLFNGHPSLHHRNPGVIGQALADPRLTSGLIADLHHVAAPVCKIAFSAAPGRMAIVTDAASCAGMPPGRYQLGGQPITLPPGEGVPPTRMDGTLAGSALRMDVGVANMVAAGVGLGDAVAAATRVPADLIGRADLGRIAPGAAADLAWLGDGLRAQATWVAGELAFSAAGQGSARRANIGRNGIHLTAAG